MRNRFSFEHVCLQAFANTRLTRVALLAAIAWLGGSPAIAEPLSIDTKTTQDLSIKIGAAELNVEIRVHNSEDEDRQIAFGERLYRAGEQTSIGLTSVRRDDTAGPGVAKGSGARYVLTAQLAAPGAFVGT